MVFYVVGDVHAGEAFGIGYVVEAFHLAVQAMSYLLQHDVGVGILARMLTHGGDFGEYLVYVGQVEVAAEGEVLHPPVVSPQEGVNVRKAGLARGGVAQVTHIDFARKGKAFLGIVGIVELLGGEVTEMGVHRVENLGDGSRAQRPFPEHVFLAGVSLQLDASQTRAFLPPVVLFLHKEVELVEAIHPSAILLLVIFERLQEAYHGHAAFVFQLFHKRIMR